MSTAMRNFYPRPPRGGRLLGVVHVFAKIGISIHALREEGDRHYPQLPPYHPQISIHALREEGDSFFCYSYDCVCQFLSTPSARRATRGMPDLLLVQGDFYPRPPRGGRPGVPSTLLMDTRFLSTPSARRATTAMLSATPAQTKFLSTPSARRATNRAQAKLVLVQFLSTPSARRATQGANYWSVGATFLSTPSARRATCL